MMSATARITAFDTLFFRESRPFDSLGGTELDSVFPPPARTVAGAVRARIAESLGVDWDAFHRDPATYRIGGHLLSSLIGDGDNPGGIRILGPWPVLPGLGRLYPVPLNVLAGVGGAARLQIGPHLESHLGRVRMPCLPAGYSGFKPLTGHWLTANALAQVLRGALPPEHAMVSQGSLAVAESRLGVARDPERRTASDGMLYQVRHVRPVEGLALEVDVRGLPDGLPPLDGLMKFGGEGRIAHLAAETSAPSLPVAPGPEADTHGIVLYLMSPTRFGPEQWLPPDFVPVHTGGMCAFRGQISGVDLDIHSAVLGKSVREGGWDMMNRRPRPVRSYLPAGSAFYCSVRGMSLQEAINRLHGTQMGDEQDLGRGLIACGLWPRHEITDPSGEA